MNEITDNCTVEWMTRRRFKTLGYKTQGKVDFVDRENNRAKICIKWKGTQKGESRFWKSLDDLTVITE